MTTTTLTFTKDPTHDYWTAIGANHRLAEFSIQRVVDWRGRESFIVRHVGCVVATTRTFRGASRVAGNINRETV